MFKIVKPEEVGASSRVITKMIRTLESRGASMHGFLFMRGDKIFAEGYWKPFSKDFIHRMYSQTKSFVSIAIGLLEEEGKLSINDKVVDHFKDKMDGKLPAYLGDMTIKEMLLMTTAGGDYDVIDGVAYGWFHFKDVDRAHHYVNCDRPTHPSGTLWEYDSNGSQVLSTLVEKLAGKPLLEYLKEKLFNKMGYFQTAKTLKTKNDDTWGDSSMICTLRDMAAFGRLVMSKGMWQGERLMNERYLAEATAKHVDNRRNWIVDASSQGYGYQIWGVRGNGFCFTGMGDQLTICYPEQDLIFACIADNQGTELYRQQILNGVYEDILPSLSDGPKPEDKEGYDELVELCSSLELRHAQGCETSPMKDKIDGKEYACEPNPMGISRFRFDFDKNVFSYTNAQGYKEIEFGVLKNVFGHFPQAGYSSDHGGIHETTDFYYKSATSLAWIDDHQLSLEVRIIDDYFGNLTAIFAFKDDLVYASFVKNAEDFMNEYQGRLIGKQAK